MSKGLPCYRSDEVPHLSVLLVDGWGLLNWVCIFFCRLTHQKRIESWEKECRVRFHRVGMIWLNEIKLSCWFTCINEKQGESLYLPLIHNRRDLTWRVTVRKEGRRKRCSANVTWSCVTWLDLGSHLDNFYRRVCEVSCAADLEKEKRVGRHDIWSIRFDLIGHLSLWTFLWVVWNEEYSAVQCVRHSTVCDYSMFSTWGSTWQPRMRLGGPKGLVRFLHCDPWQKHSWQQLRRFWLRPKGNIQDEMLSEVGQDNLMCSSMP